MPPNADSDSTSDSEVAAAHREVALAKAELRESLADVSDSSKKALADMARKARPVLIAAAVVVGVVLVVRVVRAASRRRRYAPLAIVKDTDRTPLTKIALAAALRGALRVLATRLAEQAAARLVMAAERRQAEAEVESSVSTVASR
jgi:hypothetical protein